ncbi:MAG: hypothetical protein LCH95_10050 [Proteobacteria bacterium]|nr:hypothetical protein [Pseudomonadota bacterium]
MKPLHYYRVYGLVLAIDRPLQSLDPAEPVAEPVAGPALTISFVEAARIRDAVPPERIVRPADDWISHAVLPDGGAYLDAPGVVEAVLSADGRHALCARGEAADPRAVEANLLNIVLGTALTLAGEEPLHATAVEVAGRAIGLLGHSGAGKSTLAAFLLGRGARLVTDDLLRVTFADGQARVHAGPYRLKLFEEAARRLLPGALAEGYFNPLSGKMMVTPPSTRGARPAGAPATGLPLAALFYLGDLPGHPAPTAARAVPLSGHEVMRVLLSSAMDDRNTTPARLARQLRFAGLLSAAVPIRALRYPRRFDLMDDVAAEIFRTASP